MSYEPRVLEPDFDMLDCQLEKKDGRYLAIAKSFKMDVTRFVSSFLKNQSHLTEEEFSELSPWIQFKAEMECMVHRDEERGTMEIDGHTRDMSTEEIKEEDLLNLYFKIGFDNEIIVECEEIDVNHLEKLEKKAMEYFISAQY